MIVKPGIFRLKRSLTNRLAGIYANGLEGAWYDPLLPYLYDTSTGVAQVDAAEDPIGLLIDRRLGLSASTKGAYISGTTGSYLNSPDSVAASITGDIDIDVEVNLADWTPSVNNWLISKNVNAGQFAYDFRVNATTGVLVFRTTGDGTTARSLASTVAPTITDGAKLFVRVKRISATGAGTFYTSADGVSWTQLGTEVAGTSGSIFDSTDELRIGAEGAVSSTGKIYKARIYNGIRESGGTLAVNFNGTDYASGATLTSSATGEVWTINACYIAPDGNHSLQATAAARLTYRVDAAGRPYAAFLGTDDNLVSATGGGGSAGFFFCAAIRPTGGAGSERYIFADTGTNTGYIIRIDAANTLRISAGNGATYTAKSSTATVNVGTDYVLTAWDDGTNLNVQINNGVVETVARPVVVAGTTGFTLGKANGSAAQFLIADAYHMAYAKNTGLTAAQRRTEQLYAASKIGITL